MALGQGVFYPFKKLKGVLLLAGEDHVADNDAGLQDPVFVHYRGAGLAYHLGDGLRSEGKVIPCLGAAGSQGGAVVF